MNEKKIEIPVTLTLTLSVEELHKLLDVVIDSNSEHALKALSELATAAFRIKVGWAQ